MAALNLKKYQNLIINSINLYKKFNPSIPLQYQLTPELINSLNVPFQHPQNHSTAIGVRTIFYNPQLRISMYKVPHQIKMKLHDHPKMHVITYILKGSMQASIFNKVKSSDKSELFEKEVKKLSRGQISITEHDRDNLHEFQAQQQSCSFLDIIFPDYNQTDRTCTYYDAKQAGEINGKKIYKLEKILHEYHQQMEQI